MRTGDFVDKYLAARDSAGIGEEAIPWCDFWRVFRDLALEPVEDLVHDRGDRDQIGISATDTTHLTIPGEPKFVVSLFRNVYFDEGLEVNAEFVARWPADLFGEVPEFDGEAYGSGAPFIPTGASTVSALVQSFEASPVFNVLSYAAPATRGYVSAYDG